MLFDLDTRCTARVDSCGGTRPIVAQKVWVNALKELDEFERLDYCEAHTFQASGYSFLLSYNTIVAFIDVNDNLYDVMRLVYGYTAAGAEHTAKFRNKFRDVSEYTWREV